MAKPPCSRGESAAITAGWRKAEVGALQIGRRSMIVCGALVVAPTSSVYTPQELAHKVVALDYGNGTAYAGLLMLEGAMPREAVTTRAATVHSGDRWRG